MGRRILNRVFLIACAVGMVATTAPTVEAAPEGLRMARLKYGGGGDWYSNPTSLPNLVKGLRERTSIEIATGEEARVEIMEENLFSYPLLYMNGHGEVRFSQAEVDRLREYLERGGFLWADDNYGMDRSFRREIAKVFPETRLVDLPFTHGVFNSFYPLPDGLPKVHEHDGQPPQALGLFHEGRLVVLYTYEADIGDGLEDKQVHNDSDDVREAAMRFAVNLVVYAMTQ